MSENNLPASRRKIDRARREGRIARSPELVSEAVVLWGLFVLSLAARSRGLVEGWFSAMLTACLRAGSAPSAAELAPRIAVLGAGPILALLALMAGGALALSLLLHHVVAGGLSFSWEALRLRPERLNPVEGLRRIFDGGAWGTALISLLKLALGLGLLALVLPRAAADLVGLAGASPETVLPAASGGLIRLGYAVVGLLSAGAVLQAFWARKRWVDELKMSHQEAVEDAKESDGDPRTRQRFRKAHRKLARSRTIQAVQACDVVLANPTHVAVGLRYKRGRMRAPRVLVKGADLMAQRIKDAARLAGIPVVEQPPLARDLYANVRVGKEVPTRLYRAVARVIHQIRALPAPAVLARRAAPALAGGLP